MGNKRTIILIGILIVIALLIVVAVFFITSSSKKEDPIIPIINEVKEENIVVENIVEEQNNEEVEELPKLSQKGEVAKQRSIYIDNNNQTITIPEGYAVILDSPNVSAGLVISDIANDDLSNSKQGNQFVWIPVETPALDLSKYTNEIDINDAIAESISNKKYPMAIKLSDGNYRGVLYRFEAINQGTSIKVSFISYSQNNTEREPANLENNKDNSSNISNWTQNMYQEEYNDLVKRVIKDGGFWIARFETSLSNDGIAQTKKDQKVMTGISWYKMYDNEKTLTKGTTTSHMLWGSQWDQVMILLKDISNNSGKNSRYYIIDSTNMGNYSDTELVNEQGDKIKKKGESIRYKTGEISNALVYNIYDLAGNVWEWTMEANFTSSRTVRGGYCAYDGATYPVSARFSFVTDYNGDKLENIGSRMTIY